MAAALFPDMHVSRSQHAVYSRHDKQRNAFHSHLLSHLVLAFLILSLQSHSLDP